MEGTSATGLYSQEQMDYVNSIKDEELRSHLLHQIRARDCMEQDRNAFEKQAAVWPSIPKAMERITKELSEDKSEGSYYYSWQANIAMAFVDEFNRYAEDKEIQGTALSFNVHTIANNAAKNFLDLLCSKPEPTKL